MKALYLADRIEIIREPWVVLQIIPDMTIRNKKLDLLIRALHELYRRKYDRYTIQREPFKIIIEEPYRFNFRIHMTKDQVSFFLAIPAKWRTFVEQKIAVVWDKATIKEATWEPFFDSDKTFSTTLNLSKHNIMSVDTNVREQKPLTTILNTIKNLNDGEQTMLDILVEPASKNQWEHDATKAYHTFQKGSIPKRLDISWKTALRTLGEITLFIIRELMETLSDFMGKKQNKDNVIYMDRETKLLAIRGLSTHTKEKTQLPPFHTWIRILSQSDKSDIAMFNAKAISASFRDLAEDNEFETNDIGRRNTSRFIMNVHCRRPHTLFPGNILSTNELAQIMQMPEEKLTQEIKQVSSIDKKEVSIPEELFQGGIPIGFHTEKGNRRVVYLPTKNHAQLCIPHVGFGPSGCGKTTLMKNVAIGAIEQGFSVFLIDTADGEGIDGARDALPANFPDDHIIDLDFGNKKYPLPLNFSDIASSAGVVDEDEALNQRIVANKIKDSLIHFIKHISAYGEGGFTDRMEELFGAAAKVVLRDPANTLLEVALALASPVYLQKILANDELRKSNMQAFDTLTRLMNDHQKESARAKVDPIMSRMNLLLSNEFAANLLMQRNKLDTSHAPLVNFRKWADGDTHPYFVGIRVSKDDFGPDMTNRITGFILQKWYLAILSRTNIKPEQRNPCFLIWDEPHTAIDAAGHILENAAVELRKYRGKMFFLAHGIRQFKNHWGALTNSGFTLSLYKTDETSTFTELQQHIAPFTPQEAATQLPEKYWTITKLSVSGQNKTPAFLCEMSDKPALIKDRSYRRDECSRMYGTYYQEVEEDIYQRRKILNEETDATGNVNGRKVSVKATR